MPSNVLLMSVTEPKITRVAVPDPVTIAEPDAVTERVPLVIVRVLVSRSPSTSLTVIAFPPPEVKEREPSSTLACIGGGTELVGGLVM